MKTTNKPQTAKPKWQRVSAVTHGGHDHFWLTDIGVVRHWVVWDKLERYWVVQTLRDSHIKHFATAEAAKRWTEKYLIPKP